jgi:hypothetical protein
MARAKRPARPKARRRPSSSKQGTDALPVALTQTLRVVLRHFSERGVSSAKLRGALEDALASYDQPIKEFEAEAHTAMRGRIDLLATWHRNARFLDEHGKPRVLSLKGSPSLSEIFQRHLPNERSKGLAQRLAKEGVIRRTGSNGWLPSKRTLLVSSDSSSALLRLPGQIDAFLSTLMHNGQANGKAARRLERTVFVDRFPAEMMAAFDQQTQRLGGQLIDEMDNWLLRKASDQRTTENSLRVGVGVFSFVVDSEGP